MSIRPFKFGRTEDTVFKKNEALKKKNLKVVSRLASQRLHIA